MSDVTVQDIRDNLGTFDTPKVSDSTIELKIESAESTIEYNSPSNRPKLIRQAVIAEATYDTLITNRDAFIDVVEAYDLTEETDVASLFEVYENKRDEKLNDIGMADAPRLATFGGRSQRADGSYIFPSRGYRHHDHDGRRY